MRTAPPARTPLFPFLLVFFLVAGTVLGIVTSHFGGPIGVSPVTLIDPHSAFKQDHVNILVMGIDDNWTSKDIVYTKGARSDTLFVTRLDLVHQKATMLSIPRDSRVHISGTTHTGKINGAYASGGPARAVKTVEEFLDVPIDYYIVLKIDATKNLVNSVGGVDINVEKDMDYDDSWGHLHIHLKKGMQHLDGDGAVGYIRFRHDKDGDFGRIRRQQQLLHVIADKLKSPFLLFRLNSLMETFKQSVSTDLSSSQIVALAEMFKGLKTSEIVSSYIPGNDQRVGGVWYLIPDKAKKAAVVDWLLRDNSDGEIPLVHVYVQNGCGNRAATTAVRDRLKAAGFHTSVGEDADRSDYATTAVIDYDRLKGAGALVVSKLGLTATPLIQPDPQADTSVVVIVGRDLVTSAMADRASDSPASN